MDTLSNYFVLPPYTLITTTDALQNLVMALADEPAISLDTESNSMHAYRERVCLIQLSTRTHDYIIDPLAEEYAQRPRLDVMLLAPILANPAIEKVLHAADYDLMCLKRDFDLTVTNVFDTVIAARLCGVAQFGLGELLKQYFNVNADKSHQRDDWGRRPLKPDSLLYAQADTHYLLPLRDLLYAQLRERNRAEEAHALFADVQQVEVVEKTFDHEGYWNIGKPNRLNRREMSVLRELYMLREQIAEGRNYPTFKVMTNPVLVDVARTQPRNVATLTKISGMPRWLLKYHADRLLRAVEQGRKAVLPKAPPPPAVAPHLVERYNVLYQWRRERATARGISSDMVISKEALWAIARDLPNTPAQLEAIQGVGAWRISEYGDDLLKLIRTLA
jgi:ribonuclease D